VPNPQLLFSKPIAVFGIPETYPSTINDDFSIHKFDYEVFAR